MAGNNKFVVRVPFETSGLSVAQVLFAVGGPLLAVPVLASGLSFQWMAVAPVSLVILILFKQFFDTKSDEPWEATVTVYPLGVQLARMNGSRPVGPPQLIPRDLILDVIVNEVILAHKVVSVILFRVVKNPTTKGDGAAESPITSRLYQEGSIQLVPAFPGIEMSFDECQVMRRQLSASLDQR